MSFLSISLPIFSMDVNSDILIPNFLSLLLLTNSDFPVFLHSIDDLSNGNINFLPDDCTYRFKLFNKISFLYLSAIVCIYTFSVFIKIDCIFSHVF